METARPAFLLSSQKAVMPKNHSQATMTSITTNLLRITITLVLLLTSSSGFVSPSCRGLRERGGGPSGRLVKLYADASEASSSFSCRPAVTWFKEESVESLLPRDDLRAILSELLSDDSLIDNSEELFLRNWNKLESRLRTEERSLRELLGQRTTDEMLQAVQKINEYDPEAVQAFLSSPAINKLFSKVLYDGIFEFFQKIDVFGNIVNGLPILGPIRKQIVTETKRQLDKSLGPLLQNFLATYTGRAVLQAIDFILSPENRQAFGTANANIVSSLLDRPVNSLLLSDGMGESLLGTLFDYLRKLDPNDFDSYIDFVYGYIGEKSVDSIVNVDRLIDSSPTLEKTLDSLWKRAIEATPR